MKNVNKVIAILIFCLSQLFIQCSSDDNNDVDKRVTEQYTDEVILLRNFLSESLPMDVKKILYDSDTKNFIIDGDVLMPLEDAKGHFNNWNSKNANKTNQRSSNFKMSANVSKSVKVYVSPEVPTEWRAAIDQAINHWNEMNSSITITVVDALTDANIEINSWAGGSTLAIAYSSLPYYDGTPGNSISINTYYNYLDPNVKVNTMAHEFGHCFGFNHTNQPDGNLILCTPVLDDASFMHSTAHAWAGFSYYDNVAISTLFPVSIGTKKLYRYKKDQYYFYTTNACEITPAENSFVFDGDAGYLYETQVEGTVPLYRSINGDITKDHKLQIVSTSSDDIILGYLYPTQQPGTTALYGTVSSYEYFPTNYVHYFYTTNFDKEAIEMISLGYVFSKIALADQQTDLIF